MWLNSDNPPANSKIWKMDPQQNFSVFMEPANVVNGLMFDVDGNLIGCQMYGHKVIHIAPDGSIAKVIVEEYNGNHIDGPNDLVIRRDGGMYITDPRYSPKDTWEQDTEAVYYLSPGYSEITRVIDDIEKPNGIVLSPDENTLYVNNTNGRNIYAYDVQEDGMLANKRVFATLNVPTNAPEDQADMALADGMCIDVQGNIYCTTNLGVQVVNSGGEIVGTIELPELAANITFGDPDKKSLYITGRTAVYKQRVNVEGIIFPQQ
jgi:gluconolactonase